MRHNITIENRQLTLPKTDEKSSPPICDNNQDKVLTSIELKGLQVIKIQIDNGKENFFVIQTKKNEKFKKIMFVALFGAMSFGAFSVYEHYTMSAEKMALLENIEALTQNEATSKEYDCYSIFDGTGQSISCSTCHPAIGTPPWYHFGSKCTRP